MPYRGRGCGRCYAFVSGVSGAAYRQFQIMEQRREQAERLRWREQSPTPADEAEIQPDHIGSGQVRDQYHGSGEMLPEFFERRVRPRGRSGPSTAQVLGNWTGAVGTQLEASERGPADYAEAISHEEASRLRFLTSPTERGPKLKFGGVFLDA